MMIKILFVILLYFVTFTYSKPIVQSHDYEVKKKVINTPDAPAPVAPFNQAIQINYMVYLTGQIGLDPKTGQMVSDDIGDQTRQVLRNLKAVLDAAGSSISQLAHCLIMMPNIDQNYALVNEIYAQWFNSSEFYPARSSMGVVELPFKAKIAIECQAYTTREI